MSIETNKFRNTGRDNLSHVRDGINRYGLDYFINDETPDREAATGIDFAPSTLTYSSQETSYSGTDCTVAVVYNEHIVILGNVETVSYSVHRDKVPVRTLGRTYAKDYVRGQRTIAGSLIFIQFDEAPMYKLYEFFNKKLENQHRYSSPITDGIPPFDIMLMFSNEYGKNSILRLYGVEITDEGGTYSINDVFSENVMQFIAKDLDPMVSSGSKGSFQRLLYERMTQGKIIDEHYESMIKYRDRLGNELAALSKALTETQKIADKENLKNATTQSRIAKNRDREVARRKFTVLETKIKDVQIEIDKTNQAIAKYERTKMTWDLNASQEANYADDRVFKATKTKV